MRIDLSVPRKGQSARLFGIYLRDKAKKVIRHYAGDEDFWDITVDVFLQRVVWAGYGIALVASLFMSWKQGWLPGPVVKTLTAGGVMLLIQAVALFFHFLALIWKDMARERRNANPDAPVSVSEILRREINFERWCK